MKNDISIAIIILSLSIFIFGQRAGKQTFVYWLYWLLGHGRTNIQPSSYNKSLTFSFFEFFDQNNRTNELGSWCRNQSELVPIWCESSPGLNDYNLPSLSNCLDVRGWLCNIILPVAGNWVRICRLWLDLPTAASTPHVPGQDRSWYNFPFASRYTRHKDKTIPWQIILILKDTQELQLVLWMSQCIWFCLTFKFASIDYQFALPSASSPRQSHPSP